MIQPSAFVSKTVLLQLLIFSDCIRLKTGFFREQLSLAKLNIFHAYFLLDFQKEVLRYHFFLFILIKHDESMQNLKMILLPRGSDKKDFKSFFILILKLLLLFLYLFSMTGERGGINQVWEN